LTSSSLFVFTIVSLFSSLYWHCFVRRFRYGFIQFAVATLVGSPLCPYSIRRCDFIQFAVFVATLVGSRCVLIQFAVDVSTFNVPRSVPFFYIAIAGGRQSKFTITNTWRLISTPQRSWFLNEQFYCISRFHTALQLITVPLVILMLLLHS